MWNITWLQRQTCIYSCEFQNLAGSHGPCNIISRTEWWTLQSTVNSEEGALKEIRSEKEFRHLKIVIIQPSSGKFTECADHDRGNPEILPEVTSQRTTLVPGTTLRSELGLDAVFSSFVGIAGCEETYGLTVGHMFDEFSKDCSVLSPEGSASKIAECFLRPEIPRLTTDISFMKFLDGVDFNETAILGIRLYTGSAFPKKLSILSSELKDSLDHTQFLKMSLKRHRFTDKLLDKPLHQVMLLDFFSKSTSSEYVCGAPVYFLPTSGNDELEMIGIAIGSYTEEGAGEMVVANYLPEVNPQDPEESNLHGSVAPWYCRRRIQDRSVLYLQNREFLNDSIQLETEFHVYTFLKLSCKTTFHSMYLKEMK